MFKTHVIIYKLLDINPFKMEVLNFIRQRRKYKNTIVLYAKFENKPFRETFFNVGESEFNELYNFVMAHKVKKKDTNIRAN